MVSRFAGGIRVFKHLKQFSVGDDVFSSVFRSAVSRSGLKFFGFDVIPKFFRDLRAGQAAYSAKIGQINFQFNWFLESF